MISETRSQFCRRVIIAVVSLCCLSWVKEEVSVQVELDIFSGRENPKWLLTASEADAVRQKLRSLSDNPNSSPPIFNGLGYRGFLLTNITDDCVITVWRETVIIHQGATTSAKVDQKRQLEQLLLKSAESHLAPELYPWVQSQINPKSS